MKTLLVVFSILFSTHAYSQKIFTDSIKVIDNHFFYHGKDLKLRDLMLIVRQDSAAYNEVKIAKENYAWSNIVGGIGGFFVGWPLGTAIGGGDPEWWMLGVGAGLIVASIPMSLASVRHAKEGARIYNSTINNATGMNESILRLGYTPNGIGFVLEF